MVLGEGKDKNVLMSFPCSPLEAARELWLLMERALSSVGLPGSTLTTLRAQLPGAYGSAWCGWRAPAGRRARASPQAPCVGKGGADVFTDRKHRGRGGALSTHPPTSSWLSLLVLPQAKKGWEFGKVKVQHCVCLPLPLISRLRKPGWTFFSTHIT